MYISSRAIGLKIEKSAGKITISGEILDPMTNMLNFHKFGLAYLFNGMSTFVGYLI